MKVYLKNWNIVRVLRLAFGILIAVQGIIVQDWLLAGLGGLFSVMPLMNIGCGPAGCRTPVSRSNQKPEETTYEEVR